MSIIARIKYDVEDVEPGKEFEQAKPGIYSAKIIEVEPRQENGKNDIHLTVEITDPKDTYSRLHSYVHLGEASRWKMRELTDALGLPGKGTLDTDKMVNKNLRVKVGAGTYEGEYRAQLNRFLSLKDDDDEDEDDVEPDEDDTDAEDAEDGDSEDYNEWEVDDLKAELEERELDVPTGRGAALKKKLVAALEADDAGDEDDEEEEEEEEDDDELPNFASLGLADLKKLASDAGLEVKGPKSKFVAALEEHHSNGAAEPEDDYDEWTTEELITEAKERELELPKGRKDKAKLVALLREDDGTEPF